MSYVEGLISNESLKELVEMLHKVALGELEMSEQQLKAAMLIIDKAIPDLRSEI